MSLRLRPPGVPVAFDAVGLSFREWGWCDVPVLVELFDTPQMDRWTPLPSPFGVEVAARYVESAQAMRHRDGTLQLAILSARGGRPIGEIIIFPGGDHDVELAYAVGAAFQGQGVARRAVTAVIDRLLGQAERVVLTIAVDNEASIHVARACGFNESDEPAFERRRKGYQLLMKRWTRELPPAAATIDA